MSRLPQSIWQSTLTSSDLEQLQQRVTDERLESPDVLVAGDGLCELAVAYFAAEAGLKVQILISDQWARDAESSLGVIAPNVLQWEFNASTLGLAQASRDWWAKLAVRPEFQIDWRVSGALMVDAARLVPDARTLMFAGLEEGYSLHDVDAEQIALLEPTLAACPSGGLHYPSEAMAHPLKAVCGLVTGAAQRGVRFCRGSITSAKKTGNQLTRLDTTAGEICPRYVFTASRAELVRVLNDSVPPETATDISRWLVATAPLAPHLKRPVLQTGWLIQLKSGEIIVEVPTAESPEDARRLGSELLAQSIPALAGTPLEYAWQSTSRQSPNGIPLIQRPFADGNLWSVDGLNFAELLFAPMIGKSIVEWMRSGKPTDELLQLTTN